MMNILPPAAFLAVSLSFAPGAVVFGFGADTTIKFVMPNPITCEILELNVTQTGHFRFLQLCRGNRSSALEFGIPKYMTSATLLHALLECNGTGCR